MRGSGTRLALGTAAALALLPVAHSGAATITVDSVLDENAAAVDNGTCTLREAISATNTNSDVDTCDHDGLTGPDTIEFSGAGTITLSIAATPSEDANADGDLDVLAGSGGLTIDGGAGKSVDANDLDRVLHLVSGSGQLKLDAITLTNGSASFGVGFRMFLNGDAELEDSLVSSNAATSFGAGISIDGGGAPTLTLDNTDVTLNTATGASASQPGIAAGASTLNVINGSLIDQNVASGNNSAVGGGISGSGVINVNDSEISSNTVDGNGGGIRFTTGTLNVTDSTIADNTALRLSPTGDQGGGGIDANSGTIAIDNSVISGNSTGTTQSAPGGGLNFNGNFTPLITGTLIEGNDATRGGGGVNLSNQAGMTMRRSVVRDNDVTDPTLDGAAGAGIRDSGSGVMLIEDSLISGNTSTAAASFNEGAGLFSSAGTADVIRTTISGNDLAGGATQAGGGAHTFGSSNVDFVNVTFADNDAPAAGADGGGLFVGNSGDVNLSNATFVGNEAADLGDGLFNFNSSTSTLRSTIVADGCGTGFSATITGVGTGNLQAPAVTGTCGLPTSSPGFIGPVQPNGGVIGPTSDPVPQLTQAIGFAGAAFDTTAGDCLDHTGATVGSDTRGVSRPFDANPPSPAGCDSGAFELVTCAGATVDGPDAITGTGATETITGTSGADQIWADGGDDTVLAGGGNDTVCGGDGDDNLQGGADADRLSGGAGNDILDGGGSGVLTDTVDYLESPAGVNVSLAAGSASGGEGSDTLLGLENVTGSRFDDTITGDSGPNVLLAGTVSGSSGDDDVLAGGAGPGPDGDDVFFGGSDPSSVDTVTYANRTDDLTVSLATEPGDGGSSLNLDDDTLHGIENVVGGSGADLLIGSTGPNVLTGGPGADTVNGDLGADQIFVRDGAADIVGCGPDNGGPDVDVVTTDKPGVDTLSSCVDPPDQILFAPPDAPVLTSTDFASGSNQNSIRVKGTADAGTTISLFANAACAGAPVTTADAAELSGAGLAAFVLDNTTTSFAATATGPGGASPCSAPLTYTEVTPATPVPVPPPAVPGTPTAPVKKCKKGQKRKVVTTRSSRKGKVKCVKKKRKKKR